MNQSLLLLASAGIELLVLNATSPGKGPQPLAWDQNGFVSNSMGGK